MADIPKIRFRGFTGDWEQHKLGDIFSFRYGEFNNNPDNGGEYPIYGANGIIGGYTKYNAESSSIIGHMGAYAGYVVWAEGKHFVTYNGTIAKPSDDFLNNKFGYYLLSNKQIYKICAGSGQPFVSYADLNGIDVTVPKDKPEQVAVGQHFSNLDHLIALHQHKCDETAELKKYMLQKMFPQNGKKIPEIRFSGFTDDWEQRKLGEICERVTRKNKKNESDLPLTIASQFGLIDQRDFFNKVVAAKDMSNYYLLKKGEFAYNKSYSNGFDYGSIKRLNAYDQGCLSTLYICFGITSKEVVSDYLECFFDTLKWYGDISMICAEGARNHGLLNVDTKGFFDEVSIDLPKSLEEQKKISAYLNNLDHLITLHQRKLDELKEVKKYMLQNMFPQKG